MNEETPTLEPIADPMDSKLPWTVDDPRMWKEQCRVGDVAFQQLFCTFKGKPIPDWVTEGLPTMYHTLSEIKRLREELAQAKLRGDCLQVDIDNWKKSTHAVEIGHENDDLRTEVFQQQEEIRKLRAKTLQLMDSSTIQYNGLTKQIVDLQDQLKESQQHVADWKHIANLWQQRHNR